jgi:hypothetical protein
MEPLKCVWSGAPGEERSCEERIPAAAVMRAWRGEIERNGPEQRFFHFFWHAGIWLGYGLADGSVRGVYCPTHCAQREVRDIRSQRSSMAK